LLENPQWEQAAGEEYGVERKYRQILEQDFCATVQIF
jgi:hypothetical protein